MKESNVSKICFVRHEPANYDCPCCDNDDGHA